MDLKSLPLDTWFVSIAIGLATFLALAVYHYLQNKDLPPGPIGLPYLGYWPFFDSLKTHFQLLEMKEKFGDVFSFTSLGRLYINLGSSKVIREVQITKADYFASRPVGFTMINQLFGESVGFLNGERWRVLRKFFLQVMKERGMASLKDSSSQSFYDAINSTVDELKRKKEGEPINILQLLTSKCNDILKTTLFSKDSISDEELADINENYGNAIEKLTMPNLLLSGDFAKYFILPFTSGYGGFKKSLKLIEPAIFKIINDHKATYNGDHLRDMIDDYLHEREVRKSKRDPTAKYFSDRALMFSLIQFIGESGVSISTFIALYFTILLDHPEEQDKIYNELVEVVGLSREPTLEDKSKMSYTNAFLQEALRTSDFFPFFPSLQCTKETTLNGYRIPKGAWILTNSFCAHNDPTTYDDPKKFDPSRFIVSDGKKRPELPLAFGTGKRSCIGEGFTMMQVFIFMTTLVKNFHLKMSEGMLGGTFNQLLSGKLKISLLPRK